MPDRTPQEIRAQIIGPELTLFDVQRAFCGHNDLNEEYHWESMVSFQQSKIVIAGKIYCNWTNVVGTFERHLFYQDGYARAYHHRIVIPDPTHRRKNNAFQIYRQSLRFYDSVGIRFIHMLADEMGPFVWPQFDAELAAMHYKADLVKILTERGVADPEYLDPTSLSTWVVAALHEPSQNVGSEALLDLSDRLNEMLPMILDLQDPQQREFLLGMGILQ